MPRPVTTVTEDTLFVTTGAAGTVWYARGLQAPAVNSKKSELEFCKRLDFTKARLRLHGGRANTQLLFALAGLLRDGYVNSLEICSPLLFEAGPTPVSANRAVSSVVIDTLRTMDLATSMGGFRPWTTADYCAHGLWVCMLGGFANDLWRQFLAQHPVTQKASFLDCQPEDLAKVIGLILDPRFYIDSDHPDRSSKLQSYLGLSRKAADMVNIGQSPYTIRDERFQAAVKLWQGDLLPPLTPGPRQFPWRVYHYKGGGPAGILAATRWTLDFLRGVWLDSVSVTHCGKLFIPELYFRKIDEIDAYREHMRHVSQSSSSSHGP